LAEMRGSTKKKHKKGRLVKVLGAENAATEIFMRENHYGKNGSIDERQNAYGVTA